MSKKFKYIKEVHYNREYKALYVTFTTNLEEKNMKHLIQIIGGLTKVGVGKQSDKKIFIKIKGNYPSEKELRSWLSCMNRIVENQEKLLKAVDKLIIKVLDGEEK